MLDDHVRHQLAIRVTVLIETMNCEELDIVHCDAPAVGTREYRLADGVNGGLPDPVLQLGYSAQQHAVFVPESQLLVAASHGHVFTSWEERDAARVEAEVFVVANLLVLLAARDLVNRELLVPTSRNEEVVGSLELLRAKGHCPHCLLTLRDSHQLNSGLILNEDGAIDEADCKQLAIG